MERFLLKRVCQLLNMFFATRYNFEQNEEDHSTVTQYLSQHTVLVFTIKGDAVGMI
jgi:hypothetical protein